jgi:hypothetical protein
VAKILVLYLVSVYHGFTTEVCGRLIQTYGVEFPYRLLCGQLPFSLTPAFSLALALPCLQPFTAESLTPAESQNETGTGPVLSRQESTSHDTVVRR